jgi:O-antigen/teichoic acid export membrane protein
VHSKKQFRTAFELIRGSGFIFTCRIIGAGLTFLAQILLARTIGATELGYYALAFSWCLLLGSISSLGFIPASMRFVGKSLAENNPGYARAFIRYASLTTMVSSLSIAAVSILAVLFMLPSESSLAAPLLTALIVMPLLAGLHLSGSFANSLSNFTLGFLPTSIIRPLLFCLLILLATSLDIELNAQLAMILGAIAILVVAPPVFFRTRSFLDSRLGSQTPPEHDPAWLRTALSLLITALFTGYFPEFVIIVCGPLLPSGELAVLHVCLRFAMLVSFGLVAIDTFTGPELARQYAMNDLAGLQATTTRATRLRFWASVIAVSIFGLFGDQLLKIFGSDFTVGYSTLMILTLGQLVQAGVGPVVRLMGISQHQDRCLPVFIIAMGLTVILCLLLVPRFGTIGAAVSVSAVMMFWGIRMRQLVVRLIGVTPRLV